MVYSRRVTQAQKARPAKPAGTFDGLFDLQTLISRYPSICLQRPPGVTREITIRRHIEKDRNSRRHHRKLRRDESQNHLSHFGHFAYFKGFTSFSGSALVCELACSVRSIPCSHFVCVFSCALTSHNLVLRFFSFHTSHVLPFTSVSHTLAIRVPPAVTRLTVYRWLLMTRRARTVKSQRRVITRRASTGWSTLEE